MRSKSEFLQEWIESARKTSADRDVFSAPSTKDFSGQPFLYAFVDMDYFALMSPIGWTSNSYERFEIHVPKGFVTDFASVPRIFWALVPPIGRYGYAALFHDFAYWQQVTDRAAADRVFRDTMKELGVSRWTGVIMFLSVRLFGFLAWRSNAAAKRSGEKRILKEFPTDITTRWIEWKNRPGVFQ